MTSAPLNISFSQSVCTIEMCQPERGNPINLALVTAMHQALDECEQRANVVVLQGSEQMFCNGADFQLMDQQNKQGQRDRHTPEKMYDLWQRLSSGSFVSVCHLRGRVNAGGVGFVAACDLVLADTSVAISLSEMLFDITPACVLPFLLRKTGYQPAHYLTLTTQPVSAEWAKSAGLIDEVAVDSTELLRKHLLRLRRLSKPALQRYKQYMAQLSPLPTKARDSAIELNKRLFQQPEVLDRIFQFVASGNLIR
ncbi:enoyl-CoA hydratase/isomerase [Xenorhabdus bovienii]|uniref:enoyl-CoA hydratase/isomerase n=1 Tax=Xenorhabdus bovienii TaxID=40576 RepID=UPI0023B277BD|nr:enoyl-CoA hydratase/isomerase [Xenorhabdus bovienii]MDE9482428.1 enoyl-CoA hydratase/isomerase [Xenorhabdus bovienii]MDE9556304.1 enoyl-CoA hydratase/isomerase [Xenorhabdus bovienii]